MSGQNRLPGASVAAPLAATCGALAAHLGLPAVRIDGPISARRYSRVYQARPDGTEGRSRPLAAVKQCLSAADQQPDAATAREQFDALVRLHQRLPVAARAAVPAPLVLQADEGAYAMGWVAGQSLTDRLKAGASREAQVQAGRSIGRWIGQLHAAGLQDGPPDLSEHAAHRAGMHERPAGGAGFTEALQQLDALQQRIVQAGGPVTWLHGDCKADNFLLADGDALHTIDAALLHVHLPEFDLAQFLNHLALTRQGRWGRPQANPLPELAGALLRGYREAGRAVDADRLRWTRLWLAVTGWHGAACDRAAPAWRRALGARPYQRLTQALLRPDADALPA